MGIFDGILICSDLDGTFESETKYPLPKKNIDAIKYFTKNGGHFTFCTGRLDSHLKERGLSEIVNAPACLCNGAIIYDFKKDCAIKTSFLKRRVNEILNIMQDSLHLVKAFHIAHGGRFDAMYPPFDMDCDIRANKVVFVFKDEQTTDRFLKTAKERFDDCYISKSWQVGIEFVDNNSTKGTAIEYIKNCVGAHTSYGIGDYGNDLPMLIHADVGVAVDNAVDELKQNADMIVCDFMHDAIADLIYKIEENIKNA